MAAFKAEEAETSAAITVEGATGADAVAGAAAGATGRVAAAGVVAPTPQVWSAREVAAGPPAGICAHPRDSSDAAG
jgi:hypothetical protein